MATRQGLDLEKIQKQIAKAFAEGDIQRGIELAGDLLTAGEASGEITKVDADRMRLELATKMIQAGNVAPTREKVTLSLRSDFLKALRLASAESGKDMSEIVTDSLKVELQKYEHSRQALSKSK